MPEIRTLELRVCDPNKQRQFYQEVLGMRDLRDGRLGYSEDEAGIRFISAETHYSPKPEDVYWKIALAVPNIELACTQLMNRGIDVGSPKQFQDVGYLAHFQDPEGFSIELIDHHFKGDRPDALVSELLLGGGAHLNLITLRTAEIAPVEKMILKWGMKPLSVQSVESRGFTLYFYAFASESPPRNDLSAIENRTWVYQRQYTVLEIQHVYALKEIQCHPGDAAGYNGILISLASDQIEDNELMVSSFN